MKEIEGKVYTHFFDVEGKSYNGWNFYVEHDLNQTLSKLNNKYISKEVYDNVTTGLKADRQEAIDTRIKAQEEHKEIVNGYRKAMVDFEKKSYERAKVEVKAKYEKQVKKLQDRINQLISNLNTMEANKDAYKHQHEKEVKVVEDVVDYWKNRHYILEQQLSQSISIKDVEKIIDEYKSNLNYNIKEYKLKGDAKDCLLADIGILKNKIQSLNTQTAKKEKR